MKIRIWTIDKCLLCTRHVIKDVVYSVIIVAFSYPYQEFVEQNASTVCDKTQRNSVHMIKKVDVSRDRFYKDWFTVSRVMCPYVCRRDI